MLVITRHLNEKVLFPAANTSVQIVEVTPDTVRLGIDVPQNHAVHSAVVAVPMLPVPASVPEDPFAGRHRFGQMVNTRLNINRLGLKEARERLAQGRLDEVATILEKIDEDSRMLQRRLQAESDLGNVDPLADPLRYLSMSASAKQPN
jgi:hypothetical protein